VSAGHHRLPRLRSRHLEAIVTDALRSSRVIVVNGPRQAGKTTLLQRVQRRRGGAFVSLDDEATLAAAREDPTGFLAAYPRPLFVDEVQRGGDALVRAVKVAVDRDRRPGAFVLAGSTSFLTVPVLSESLAGRARIIDLWPFSQGELAGVREAFLDRVFAGPDAWAAVAPSRTTRAEYFRRVCTGGFPEVVSLGSPRDRGAWFGSYVRTVTQRDIRDLSRLRRAADLPRLVRLLAARTAGELNVSSLAEACGLSPDLTHDYLALLETVYVHHTVPAWSRNLSAKVKRRPKVYLADSGLAAALTGMEAKRLAVPTCPMTGPLIETFVVDEILKMRSWSETDVALHHFRDRDGPEIDLVLETSDGRVAGIEVKAGLTVREDDFRWLRFLRDRTSAAFVQGIVLYAGADRLPFGDRLRALPLAALWAR
jgi:hypothetical protein